MSVTPSEIAVEALLEAVQRPGMAGQRLALRDLFGMAPEDFFSALEPHLAASTTVLTDGGAHPIGSLSFDSGRVLIPYLVSDRGEPESNRGSAGFAATLRTQFLAGANEERVLLILDPRPVETVLSATEDAAALPELQWPALVQAAVQVVAAEVGKPVTRFARVVAEGFAELQEPGGMALASLAGWLHAALQGSDEAAGRDLWQLGCFISDPDAGRDPARLQESAKLRRQLDERFESRSKPWESEIRKLLGRMGVSSEATERVVVSAGPFRVRYEDFTLGDLKRQEKAAPPLRTHPYDPVLTTRAAIREGESLVVWLDPGTGDLRLKLDRPALAGDSGVVRWSGADSGAIELIPGDAQAVLDLPEVSPTSWSFGVLELSSGGGEAPVVTETLQIATYRSGGDWVPVEDSLQVDGATAAFECEDQPVVIAYGDKGEALGAPAYADLEDGAGEGPEAVDLEVAFRGESAVLPVIIRGESSTEDSTPPGSDEGEGEGGGDEGKDPPAEFPSVSHALMHAGKREWPAARTGDPTEGPVQVGFRIGARQMQVALQRPIGLDGGKLEQAILGKPEWNAYVWAPQSGTLSRAAQVPAFSGAALSEPAVERFVEARRAFFAAASALGSVYALNPGAPEVAEYVGAYDELQQSIPRDGRYLSDWDSLVLCDAVFTAGSRNLLFAPTSPLAAAFHARLASELAGWLDAGESPSPADVRAISMRHAVPLVHARGQWYETAPASELLWRRYVELSPDAPGLPGRNATFIGHRLKFFLDVHGVYRDPDQELSVAFHQPGDGEVVFDALRAFYKREPGADHYELPRIHAYLVGGSGQIEAEVSALLAGGRQDDLDRLIESRVTVTAADEPPPFAHLTFLFRSPGVRSARQVPMSDRPPTDYLGGLAAAPGRKVYSDRNQVFAWGNWAPESQAAGTYQRLITGTLELVGGQPTGKMTPGWTQMASASVDEDALDLLYGEHSAWVVHLDRLIGIEAFGGPRQLIEYEERADPEQPGYDGITATEQVDPYLQAVGRALGGLGAPGEAALRRVLQLLNSVSGRWALDLLHRSDSEILQKIGFVTAIAVLEQLEGCLGTHQDGTAVLVPLDELVTRRPRGGLPRFSLPVDLPDGRMCDDLLVLWVPRDAGGTGPVTVRGAVVEVKYASSGRGDADEARAEIERTRQWLHKAFNVEGPSRAFRARDLAELITAAAARAGTFDLGRRAEPAALEPTLARVARGDYQLDLSHWRGGSLRTGIVTSVEAESGIAASQSSLGEAGEPIDQLRIGRPVLKQLVAGARVRVEGAWEPISFLPPAGKPEEVPAGPQVLAPSAPEPDARPPGQPVGGSGDGKQVPGGSGSPALPGDQHAHRDELAELARALDASMEKYKLATEPFSTELAQVGPNVIRFRTRPLGPLSVTDVERRARDIGREVGAPGAVIVSQEPRFICIDVPRQERQPVLYRDVAGAGAAVASAPGALSFIVGVAPSGEVRVADLARLPHLLVAGATGSGKSVFLRALLCHSVRARGPEALRILLVDPKQLDFAGFAGLPHLERGEVISDPAEAVEVLRGTIEDELERRRPVLVDAGATSATEFYEKGGSYAELPQMIVLVDEFADLAAVMEGRDKRGFQELIQRYAQLTRAFGIYLVLATQRPSVDVITGSIKANLTARVALSLPSHRDSMTVLDRAGAEDLLGNGDLLFYVNGQVERLQAPLTDASDVAHAVERWRGVPNPGVEG